MFGVRRLSGIGAIIVLLAVTIVLVAAAIIRHHHHVNPALPGGDNFGTSTPVVVPFQPAGAARAALKHPAPLIAASKTNAVFFAHGGCHRKAALEGSLDGGHSWVKLTPPAPYVLQLQLVGKTAGYVIGADSSCTPARYTAVSRTAWSPPAPVTGLWFATPSGIHTPSGATTTPCGSAHPTPISLASAGSRAIAICRVGVFLTTSGGSQWTVTGQLPKGRPVSVGFGAKGRGLMLLANASACRGLRVALTADSGLTWTQGACLGNLSSSAAIAMAPNGYGIATDGGSTSYLTADFGATWR